MQLRVFVLACVAAGAVGTDYCLSMTGGGYRALVGALAFSDAQAEVDGDFNPPRMAGTSGGAWGSYAICRGHNIEKLSRKSQDTTHFQYRVKFISEPFVVESKDFRRQWWDNILRVFDSLHVPHNTGPEHSKCVEKIIVTEGRKRPGEADCQNFKYCRTLAREHSCDGDAEPQKQKFKDALMTSSSVVTTDSVSVVFPGHPLWWLIGDPGNDPQEFRIIKVEKFTHPTDKENFQYFDVGVCDANPWPELLRQAPCRKIVNLNFVLGDDDYLEPSIAYAESLGYTVTRDREFFEGGPKFADRLTVVKDGELQAKVLNINLVATTMQNKRVERSRTFPNNCDLSTYSQSYTAGEILCFYRMMRQLYSGAAVQRLIKGWLMD